MDPFLLGGWRIQLARLVDDFVQIDVGETAFALPAFDFADAQQRGNDCLRLIEARDRAFGDGRQFVLRAGCVAAALQECPDPGQRRPQVVRYVVADPLHLLQQALILGQHEVDAFGEVIEIVVDAVHGQPLVHMALHDPLDALVDGLQTPLGFAAEP